MNDAIIDLQNINVDFKKDKEIIRAVSNVSMKIAKKDIYGIVGYSGAGKSTLVRTINLLQKPTSGQVQVFGEKVFSKDGNGNESTISAKALREERHKIGFVFQHFNLLDQETVLDNVKFALRHAKLKEKEQDAKANKLLSLVGLDDFANSYPAQLSGGQQQRVAIARALANDPEILVSDEATSALDPKNTNQILDLLKDLNEKLGLTIVMVTHEIDAVKRICNKVAILEKGKLVQSGDLLEIFVNSNNKATRKFIGGAFDAISVLRELGLNPSDETYIQLTYLSSTIADPIIVDLYEKFAVKANIVYSNVELLQGKAVGTMLVHLDGSSDDKSAAIKYLKNKNVEVLDIEGEAS